MQQCRILYTLIFSGAKPMSGILAGIAFWTIGKNIKQNTIRSYLLISACGIMLLFASNQATILTNIIT